MKVFFTVLLVFVSINGWAQTVLSVDFSNRMVNGTWQYGNTAGQPGALPGDNAWFGFLNVVQPLAPQATNQPPAGYSVVQSLADWLTNSPNPTGLFPDLVNSSTSSSYSLSSAGAGYLATAIQVNTGGTPRAFWSAQVTLQEGSNELSLEAVDLAAFAARNDLDETRFSLHWEVQRLVPLPGGGGNTLSSNGPILSTPAGYNSRVNLISSSNPNPQFCRTPFQVPTGEGGLYRVMLLVKFEAEDRGPNCNANNPDPVACGTTAYIGVDNIKIDYFPCVLPQVDDIAACQGSVPAFVVKNVVPGITYKWYDAQKNLLGTGNAFPVPGSVPTTGVSTLFYVQPSCSNTNFTPIHVSIYSNLQTVLSVDFSNRMVNGTWQYGNTAGQPGALPGDNAWFGFLNVVQPLAPQATNQPPAGYSVVQSLADWLTNSPNPTGLFPDLVNSSTSSSYSLSSAGAGYLATAIQVDPAGTPSIFWGAQATLQEGNGELSFDAVDLAAFTEYNDLDETRFSLHWEVQRLVPLPGGSGNTLSTDGPILSVPAGFNSRINLISNANPAPQSCRTPFQVPVGKGGLYRVVLLVKFEAEDRGGRCDANSPNAACGTTAYIGIDNIKVTGQTNCQSTPRLAETLVIKCGVGDAVFTVVSPGGTSGVPMPSTASFEWYTKDASGNKQNVVTTTNPVFTLPMPAGWPFGVPLTYYMDIAYGNSVYSPEVTLQAVWYMSDATFSIDAGFSGTAPYLQGYAVQFAAAAGYDSYTWNWGDGSPAQTVSSNTTTHAFAQAGTWDVTLTVAKRYSSTVTCSDTYILRGLVVIAPLCELQALDGGSMQKNTRSGAVSYVAPASSCVPAVSFECISEGVTIPQVVAATATAFADQLALAPGPAPTAGTAAATPYLRGQWQTLPLASYSYRTRLSASATPEPRNYAFGTFGLRAFDWENSLRARPAAWLTAAVTEQASPNGDVLQERDPLGIASAAKFGYGQSATGQPARTLPYLQAHNAEASAVLFESFENWYASNGTTSGEDELVLPADVQRVSEQTQPGYAHTGQQAARLLNRQLALKALPLTPTLSAQGLLVKVWVRLPDYDATQFSAFVDVTRVSTGAVTSTGLTTGVRTGEWQLFEARVALSASAASVGELVRPSLRFSAGGASAVYVDDVRVQPGESQMTAYVYDPVSLRLVASFDDQHFALRYQYNQEGKLIRKQAETARGLKTLQETHYHSPNTDQVNN